MEFIRCDQCSRRLERLLTSCRSLICAIDVWPGGGCLADGSKNNVGLNFFWQTQAGESKDFVLNLETTLVTAVAFHWSDLEWTFSSHIHTHRQSEVQRLLPAVNGNCINIKSQRLQNTATLLSPWDRGVCFGETWKVATVAKCWLNRLDPSVLVWRCTIRHHQHRVVHHPQETVLTDFDWHAKWNCSKLETLWDPGR